MVLVTVNEPVRNVYVSVMVAWAFCPAPTVTVWPLPTVATPTVLVLPSAVSVTTQLEFAGMPVQVCGYVPAAGCPAVMVHSPNSVPPQTAWIVTGPWLPAAVAGDHLVDRERTGQVGDRVSDRRGGGAPRGDGDLLAAPADGHAHGARAAVDRLGDRANGSRRDVGVGLRRVARGPRRDGEVGRQGRAVADRVDGYRRPGAPRLGQ